MRSGTSSRIELFRVSIFAHAEISDLRLSRRVSLREIKTDVVF